MSEPALRLTPPPDPTPEPLPPALLLTVDDLASPDYS